MNVKHKNSEPTRLSRLLKWLSRLLKWLFGDEQGWGLILLYLLMMCLVAVCIYYFFFAPSADERLVIYQDRYDACIAQNIEPESCHDIALRQAGIAK